MTDLFYELNQWFLSEQGISLARALKTSSQSILSHVKGNTFLQLGIEEHETWLANNEIIKTFICLPFQGKHKASVISSLYELPFETSSIDVIFCPFTLNLLDHKLSFLSEVNRVLSDNGSVIFAGINPFSFWGLPHQWCGASKMREFVSVYQLRKLLFDLEYSIKDIKHFVYWPPFVSSVFFERLYEKVGQMLLPYPAGFYLLSAQKNRIKPISIHTSFALQNHFT